MRRLGSFMPLAFILSCVAALAVAGCSSSGGTGAIAAPTPVPTVASLYNTMGVISCSAQDDAVPGTYVNIATTGSVTGSTYVMTGAGFNGYQMLIYAAGATPAPTVAPIVVPTPAPSSSPVEIATVYYGEYALPAFVDPGTETPINATTGCFSLLTEQPIGSTSGQSKGRQIAALSVLADGSGMGQPAFAAPQPSQVSYVMGQNGSGAFPFTSFTITNLTRTTGTGAFTLDNGTNGTLTITGSVTSPSVVNNSSIVRSPGSRPR